MNEREFIEAEISHLRLENERIKNKLNQNKNKIFLDQIAKQEKKNVFSCLEKCDQEENLFTVNFSKDTK